MIIMRETYGPRILEVKADHMRKGTGDPNYKSELANDLPTKELFRRAIIRPMKTLILCPIVLVLSLIMAITYGLMFLLYTTIPDVYTGSYGFSTADSGLAFLGVGGGMILALIGFTLISDKMVTKLAAANGGEMKPEYRLPPMVYGSLLIPVGLLIYGWTAQAKVYFIIP